MASIMVYLVYCTHNQLCVPQYEVNVYSTWYVHITLPSSQNKTLGRQVLRHLRCVGSILFLKIAM